MANKDDTSLEQYSPEQLQEFGKLYAALTSDPHTREFTLRATKKVSPNVPIPEIDLQDRMNASLKPLADKNAALEARLVERDVRDRIESKRGSLRKQGLSDDQIEAIEKVMVEKKIPDHDTAAEFYKLQQQTAAPTPANYTMPTLPLPKKEELKAAGGYKRFFTQDAHKAIDDIRQGRVKLH